MPAELGVLWRNDQNVAGPELAATLLDLARRGFVTLQVVPVQQKKWFGPAEDLEIVRGDGTGFGTGRGEGRTLARHEQELLDFLFRRVAQHEDGLLLSELPAWAKANPSDMRNFVRTWRQGLQAAGAQRHFWDPAAARRRLTGYLAYALLAVTGCAAALVLGVNVTGIGLVVVALIGLSTVRSWRRRTPAGAGDMAKWRAFRHFLTDFSRLDLAAVPALILWEHYLVFATVLGVAKETLHQMKAVLPRLPEQDRLGWEHDRMFRYGAFAGGGMGGGGGDAG